MSKSEDLIQNGGNRKMAKYDIKLRPIHYASVSGGKDSLYMLGLILNNLDKYPLDCVVHFQLEIDWWWTEKVIDEMEKMCKSANIPFYRIKPRKSYWELYEKYGFPMRVGRWCNSKYKLDAEKQFNKMVKSWNCRPVAYIGFCADETKRFKYEIGEQWELGDVCYPLAEEGIEESTILEWAKCNPIFSNWYKYFNRQGCMLCPMISLKELAYMCKYENESYQLFLKCLRENKERYKDLKFVFGKFETAEQLDERIQKKWIPILEMEENQITIFDYQKVN